MAEEEQDKVRGRMEDQEEEDEGGESIAVSGSIQSTWKGGGGKQKDGSSIRSSVPCQSVTYPLASVDGLHCKAVIPV